MDEDSRRPRLKPYDRGRVRLTIPNSALTL
jgi:hypothetical protein